MFCYVMLYVMLCYMLCYVMSCRVLSYRVMSCGVVSCCVALCCVVLPTVQCDVVCIYIYFRTKAVLMDWYICPSCKKLRVFKNEGMIH